MLPQVAKKFAQRLGRVQAMTFYKSLYLLEALVPAGSEDVRYGHITGR